MLFFTFGKKNVTLKITESTDNVEKIVSIEQLDVYGGWYGGISSRRWKRNVRRTFFLPA